MHTRLIDEVSEQELLQRVEEVAGASVSAVNPPLLNWSLPVEGPPSEYDVETMTTLANERFADAKYRPR
jgi:hypothetical protein